MIHKKILIIDDDASVVEVLNDILEIEKYECINFLEPEKGIEGYLQQQDSIGLVILDYSMPKMNGKEVLIELRKINHDVKVIINSGYMEEEILRLMGSAPVNAILQKPNRPKDILAVIKKFK